MKISLHGNGKKHYQSHGKYYGFGAVAKYSIVGNLSFGTFAEKKGEFQIVCLFLYMNKN